MRPKTNMFALALVALPWLIHPVTDTTQVVRTASVTVALSIDSTVAETPTVLQGTRAVLTDYDGNFAGRLVLTDPYDTGVYSATFRYLDAADGPYDVTLQPPGSLQLFTQPELPAEVDTTAGQRSTLKIDVVDVGSQ